MDLAGRIMFTRPELTFLGVIEKKILDLEE
jgi:hypothetical protein